MMGYLFITEALGLALLALPVGTALVFVTDEQLVNNHNKVARSSVRMGFIADGFL
jgi:hypothetical protein